MERIGQFNIFTSVHGVDPLGINGRTKIVEASVDQFQFTPRGGSQRTQQVHEASLDLVTDEEGQNRLAILVKTTRPGETSDDRGVAGWDAPVWIDVTTDPLDIAAIQTSGLVMLNAVAAEKYRERFLYYWNHSDFVTIRLTIKITGERWDVTFDGKSGSGDAVIFMAAISH